jgi:hypothetical protein
MGYRRSIERKTLEIKGRQAVLHAEGMVCQTTRALGESRLFRKVVRLYLRELRDHSSPLSDEIPVDPEDPKALSRFITLLQTLGEVPIDEAMKKDPNAEELFASRRGLYLFTEGLYDFWRGFDRFLVAYSREGDPGYDRKPYRTFNNTIEKITHVVRALYRDICENITGDHPRIYRQVSAAFDVGVIAIEKRWEIPAEYADTVGDIPFIRQVLVNPPLIIDPPMNKRTGQFLEVQENPIAGIKLERGEWLCYPAQVGPVVIFICFHQSFIGLGCSLGNLFELATNEQIEAGPDAIFLYGAPPEQMTRFGDLPTVFYDDEKNGLIAAAIPNEERFGYFGYLKKMILTLHNIVMMKRGYMPFHGAMTHISLTTGVSANILLIGDTATGKSETLEAFRNLEDEHIRELTVISDDMGSIEVADNGRLVGYGTETGAFIRLDDLQQGYAYGQIDRAIIMSPQKTNARVVLPITMLDEVLKGYPIDILLYANNYEEIGPDKPIIDLFKTPEEALQVFRDGAAMAKGTTTSKGINRNYFANIFGPPQRREIHDKLAEKVFRAAFASGTSVGQMRTRLGIPGYEQRGPEEAAKALLELISRTRARANRSEAKS